jgi:hypothetical protein
MWIIPCILEDETEILTEDWITTPADTNMGEGSHASTNAKTGIGLAALTAVQT